MQIRLVSTLFLSALVGATLAGCSDKGATSGSAEPVDTAPVASAPPPAPTPAAAPEFDLASIPVSSATLPAFPYLEWPAAVPEAKRRPDLQKNLDGMTVVAGNGFRQVEGQVERRVFSIPSSMSQLEVRRHYGNLIKSLGGVQINQFNPVNAANATISAQARAVAGPDANVPQLLGLQRYDEGHYEYESYVIRTATTTAWIVVQTSQYSAVVTVLAAT